ncbi:MULTISPECIES: STAS domain-containing protein [Micromonospora]|uniref:Anti-sigma factor antagonist n=1 Tax=Micromonospora solifontis TaxID=2487138 RepID=A0ABX9WHY7_9ACTN|nr:MULTISPECIES: STAS domain-containing protein [Micromonospora]NES13163.1 STAS domain-containing protein [Micromonospora sp. PPF5-17B]NES36272.1 STAS domain-containing protein [Micromonospora solifontis]NES55088.1 STAS domain-containing protein [Micromonospora sp. PPF5-6]RNL99679.1 anti-sigma factor antagonist [Micromonospora solifontis]
MTAPPQSPPECAVPLVEVEITEELDLARLSEVAVVLDRVLALHPREVIVDMAECRHVDAAAIALLLDVHRRMARRRATLTVRNPNPRIHRILETARLGETVPIVHTPRPARRPVASEPPPDAPARGRARVASQP